MTGLSLCRMGPCTNEPTPLPSVHSGRWSYRAYGQAPAHSELLFAGQSAALALMCRACQSLWRPAGCLPARCSSKGPVHSPADTG